MYLALKARKSRGFSTQVTVSCGNLTGWRRENGCRRFRRAYITAGRTSRSLLALFGLTPKSKRGLAAGEGMDVLDGV